MEQRGQRLNRKFGFGTNLAKLREKKPVDPSLKSGRPFSWRRFCSNAFCSNAFCFNELETAFPKQGCQMVYFQTKNPNFCKFWRALDWKMLI
jgi:hypothetical protein